MSTYEQPTINELDELNDRIQKIQTFIENSAIFDALPDADMSLLREQFKCMVRYAQRLRGFTERVKEACLMDKLDAEMKIRGGWAIFLRHRFSEDERGFDLHLHVGGYNYHVTVTGSELKAFSVEEILDDLLYKFQAQMDRAKYSEGLTAILESMVHLDSEISTCEILINSLSYPADLKPGKSAELKDCRERRESLEKAMQKLKESKPA